MNKNTIEAITSLSPAQQGMLYETIRAPKSGIHIEQLLYTLHGHLDVAAFEKAWQWIVDRHMILRTGFTWKEQAEPFQVTLRQARIALDYRDWRALSPTQQQIQMADYLRDVRMRGFQLSQPPLLKLALFHMDEHTYRFVWTVHHILMDGWSYKIVLNEFIACYDAFSKGLSFQLPRSRQYRDYIAWLKKQDISQAEQFWRKALRGFTQPTPLGSVKDDAPFYETEERYGYLSRQLPDAVATTLLSTARRHHVTLNTILQGTWALLLGRYNHTDDVVFGITVSGRPTELTGVETMVGLCINTLPLRVRFNAQIALWSWLEELQYHNVDMHQYEYVSAGQVHAWSDVPGMLLLYESLLVIENFPSHIATSTNVGLSIYDALSKGAQTKYPLTFLVTPGANLGIKCIYDTHRFVTPSLDHILDHFYILLQYIASNPDVTLATLSNLIPVDQFPLIRPSSASNRATTSEVSTMLHAPRTPMEELVATVWGNVLGLQEIDVTRSFFELGGHSLVATQLTSRLQTILKMDIPLRTIFEAPTIATLALKIEQNQQKSEGTPVPALAVGIRPTQIPLSFAQQRLWFLDQLEPGSTAYLIPSAQHLRGILHAQALEQSLAELVSRHESLRTTFAVHGEKPVQVIQPIASFLLPVIDLQGIDQQRQDNEVLQLVRHEAQRPCDLTSGPLLRTYLLRLDSQKHVFLLTLHHIISDRWSSGILIRELTTLYQAFSSGQPSPLAPLPLQYADYALWQRQWLQGHVLETQLAYWRKQLAGASPLDLLTDYPRPTMQTYRGATLQLLLPLTLQQSLVALSQQTHVTLFMLLLTAFQVLLLRYTGQSDISVGTPIANRSRTELEGLIGLFVNTLVLRSDLSGDLTFLDALTHVREVCLGAYAHQDIPFEQLVEELQPERDLSRSPLFQVMFTVQNTAQGGLDMAGMTRSPVTVNQTTAQFDLSLTLTTNEKGLMTTAEFNTDLFAAITIERMLQHWQVLLGTIVHDAGQYIQHLPLLTDAETSRLLIEWNATNTGQHNNACLHELIERQVVQTPDAIAIIFEQTALTYSSLNMRANQLAHRLRRLGVGPDGLVGVYMERSLELVVALLAILKAGGAYLPLDPGYPLDRLLFMVSDAQCHLMLTQTHLAAHCPHTAQRLLLENNDTQFSTESATNPLCMVGPHNLAYVIYTSGSTGTPKGVMNTHEGICNNLLWKHAAYQATSHDHILQKTPLSFDVSVWELFLPLLVGATMILARPEGHKDGAYLASLLRDANVTMLEVVPSLLQVLVDEPAFAACQHLHLMVSGGDALSFELQQRFFAHAPSPACALYNTYGPTEAAIDVTCWICEHTPAQTTVPIGFPITNTQIYLLDPFGNLAPIGVPGDLHIGGLNLARGYLNRPDLTAEHFIPDPFSSIPGARLYRTGDLARYRADGALEYIGRSDQQVKLRGVRIELGEVEAVLRQHPLVHECAVLAREDVVGNKRLVAYVVLQQQQPNARSILYQYTTENLPISMAPSLFVLLETLPLTPNGKIDRHALPAPNLTQPDANELFVAPLTPQQELLTIIWADLLSLAQVSIHSNFFALGGHSLLATQVISRIRQLLQIELPLRTLFECPTIATLAQYIQNMTEQAISITPLEPYERPDELALSFAQERLWFLDQLNPHSPAYNMPMAMHWQGPLSLEAFQYSLAALIQRHEILRTTFAIRNGLPIQIIAAMHSFMVPVIDLRATSHQEGQVRLLVQQEAQRPFDLSTGPLLRAHLLRLAEQHYVLLLTMHHIITDGWSMNIFIHEFTAIYLARTQGKPFPLPTLPIQYADYALWQREWMQGEILQQHTQYWKKRLWRATSLALPTDAACNALSTHHGAICSFHFPAKLSDDLVHFAHQEGITLFMLLLATFQVLLYRLTHQTDIVIGTDVANRTHVETEGLIGFFVNLLVLRADLQGAPSFREVLRQVRTTVLDAYTYQELPFEMVVEQLQIERKNQQTPLVSTLFVMQNTPKSALTLSDIKFEIINNEQPVAKFDLALFLQESADGIKGTAVYKTALFTELTITTLLRRLEIIARNSIARPDISIDDLNISTDEEEALQATHKKELRRSGSEKLRRGAKQALDLSALLTKKTHDQ